jgi:hypothetical protein
MKTFHMECLGKLAICLHTNFNMNTFSGPLGVSVKKEDKCKFRTVAMLLFYINLRNFHKM